MSAIDLARLYMDVVFGGRDPEELRSIVHADLEFRGPLVQSDSADAYIDSLRADPPDDFSFELLYAFESASTACLVYRFEKPGVSTTMAQVFEERDGRIARILLVFDVTPFTRFDVESLK